MKRIYFFTLLLALCSFVQAQESVFEKYAEKEGVSSVYISKAMLGLMSNLVDNEYFHKAKVAEKLDCIQVLSTMKPDLIIEMKKTFSFFNKKNGYEELMRTSENGEKVTIYMKNKPNTPKEYVLVASEEKEFSIIRIIGELTLEEMMAVAEKGDFF